MPSTTFRGWLDTHVAAPVACSLACGGGAVPRFAAPPFFQRQRIVVDETIDWSELHARICETPIVGRPKHIKHPNRSPESLERRKVRARERSRERYWANREECLRLQREWELANPDKVKAKKKRFYEAHKNDPVFKAKRAAQKKAYMARKKAETVVSMRQVTPSL